jgi:CubicO group peptidase (beta-lactamase class C family)
MRTPISSPRSPTPPRTIYDIGSITKTLTGMAIMLLESRGELSVEDKIGRFFPQVPQDKEGIQLKHLLTHTSGIVDPPLGDYEPIGRDDLVKVVFAAPLGAPIGTKYQYSNTGFSLLAAVIEKVSGRPYEEFMRNELFLPAGMKETGYLLPQWDASRIAHTYVLPVDHLSPLDRLRAAHGPGWILMGNGGVLGTTGDLFRWELALRKGSIIPAANVAIAFQPHFQRNPRESIWLRLDHLDVRDGGKSPTDTPPMPPVWACAAGLAVIRRTMRPFSSSRTTG